MNFQFKSWFKPFVFCLVISSSLTLIAQEDQGRFIEKSELTKDSIDQEINQVYYKYAKAYRKMNADLVTELYGQHAFYIFSEKPLLRGHEEIKKHFKKYFKSVRARNLEITITYKIVDRLTENNLNHDIGYYVISYFKKGMLSHQVAGKFSTVLYKNNEGEWLFASDTFHSGHINEFEEANGVTIQF